MILVWWYRLTMMLEREKERGAINGSIHTHTHTHTITKGLHVHVYKSIEYSYPWIRLLWWLATDCTMNLWWHSSSSSSKSRRYARGNELFPAFHEILLTCLFLARDGHCKSLLFTIHLSIKRAAKQDEKRTIIATVVSWPRPLPSSATAKIPLT